ncbi:hypothetical protein JRO89_XS13G0200100 [Xanthoceras sorbifolium]|uniref:Uncharacterized protein n=1 Tax=Xanthoceras sorbifolium TaxID=99658 RepID=A0ABQ8H970_9ROSI|nr:hypothetical protein JRO89_XS13G0200100 [Xanthoceras sorbifolium]
MDSPVVNAAAAAAVTLAFSRSLFSKRAAEHNGSHVSVVYSVFNTTVRGRGKRHGFGIRKAVRALRVNLKTLNTHAPQSAAVNFDGRTFSKDCMNFDGRHFLTEEGGGGGGSSNEESSGGETEEAQECYRAHVDRELKDKLIRKYGGYICSLKHEFSKKKKKGKLPKEARQVLFHWWNIHNKWPYPTEADKIALAESTGLDQKQINNWFINQRKRHWKPSDNMQLSVMESLYGPLS